MLVAEVAADTAVAHYIVVITHGGGSVHRCSEYCRGERFGEEERIVATTGSAV